MLHGDGKYETYNNFFSTVNGALHGCELEASEFRVLDSVVTGSDEETAMVNEARSVFTSAGQLYCMLHCKDNVRHHLTSVVLPVQVRENILSRLFGSNGVAESHDQVEQDDRTAEILQFVRQQNSDAFDYIQYRVLPKICNNNTLKWQHTWIGQRQWTNNNCESANHLLKIEVCVIKLHCYCTVCNSKIFLLIVFKMLYNLYIIVDLQQVDWKPRRVTDLVDHLRSVVHQQYVELRRALAGLGELQLTPAFAQRHLTTQMRWHGMTDAAVGV